NKYTEKAQEAVVSAQQLADREGHAEILPEHLLVTLIEQRDGIVPSIILKIGADPATVARAVRGELRRRLPGPAVTQIAPGDRCRGAGSRAPEGRLRQHRASLHRDCL